MSLINYKYECIFCGDEITSKNMNRHLKNGKHSKSTYILKTYTDKLSRPHTVNPKSTYGNERCSLCPNVPEEKDVRYTKGEIFGAPSVKGTMYKAVDHADKLIKVSPIITSIHEHRGYHMVQGVMNPDSKNSVKIPIQELLDNGGIIMNKVGQFDVHDLIRSIREITVDKIAVYMGDIMEIGRQLDEFVKLINTKNVYHCDLHFENVRYDKDEKDGKIQVYVIDFDMARVGKCDIFRQSSKNMGKERLIVDKVKNAMKTSDIYLQYTDKAFVHTLKSIMYEALSDRLRFLSVEERGMGTDSTSS